MSARVAEFSSKYLVSTATADEKQPRKEHHYKAFKNPSELVVALTLAATKKATTTWQRLILLGFLSGLYIAIGGTVALVVGGGIQPVIYENTVNGTVVSTTQIKIPILGKFMVAAFFPVGLMLILFLGGELFTSNVMIMSLGLLAKKTNLFDMLRIWGIAIISNYAGCVVGSLAIWGMGTFNQEPYGQFLQDMVEPKVNTNFGVNLLKAIPCNMLVCIAVSICVCAEDVSGKILGIWWPIFTFTVSGYEHSIANMFYATVAALYGASWNYGTFIWQNLIPVLIGNLIGGMLFVSLLMWYCYYLTGRPPIVVAPSIQPRASGTTPYVSTPTVSRKIHLQRRDSAIPMESVKIDKLADRRNKRIDDLEKPPEETNAGTCCSMKACDHKQPTTNLTSESSSKKKKKEAPLSTTEQTAQSPNDPNKLSQY